MATIQQNAERIQADKEAIKRAIIEKGVSVPEGTSLDEYAALISEIPVGSVYKRKLTSADNLNNIVETGLYDWASGSMPVNTPESDKPLNGIVNVTVVSGMNYVMQTIYKINYGVVVMYTRYRAADMSWSTPDRIMSISYNDFSLLFDKIPVQNVATSDVDQWIGQYGGQFIRRPLSKLWEYILTKLSDGVSLVNSIISTAFAITLRATNADERRFQIETDTAGTKKAGRFCISVSKRLGIFDETLGKWVVHMETTGDVRLNNGVFTIANDGNAYLNKAIPCLYLQNTANSTGGNTCLYKNISNTADYGTILTDQTDGVVTRLSICKNTVALDGVALPTKAQFDQLQSRMNSFEQAKWSLVNSTLGRKFKFTLNGSMLEMCDDLFAQSNWIPFLNYQCVNNDVIRYNGNWNGGSNGTFSPISNGPLTLQLPLPTPVLVSVTQSGDYCRVNRLDVDITIRKSVLPFADALGQGIPNNQYPFREFATYVANTSASSAAHYTYHTGIRIIAREGAQCDDEPGKYIQTNSSTSYQYFYDWDVYLVIAAPTGSAQYRELVSRNKRLIEFGSVAGTIPVSFMVNPTVPSWDNSTIVMTGKYYVQVTAIDLVRRHDKKYIDGTHHTYSKNTAQEICYSSVSDLSKLGADIQIHYA